MHSPGRFLSALLAVVVVIGACRKKNDDDSEPVGAAAKANELPPLELRDDTPNLLLTWIDDKGDFHVVQKISDVPGANRARVRVVITNREDGTGKFVYVADLSKPNPNGSYPIRSMSRSEWDETGARLRKARLEALAPSASPPSPSPGSVQSGAPGASAQAPSGRIVAVIYGASWCKPCHDAARYLKQRGVTVIEKDIESNELYASEMRGKLQKAQMPPSSSIPIIDVMGQLMVGFSPSALDRAIEAAQAAQPL
jgi:glutaredoxin